MRMLKLATNEVLKLLMAGGLLGAAHLLWGRTEGLTLVAGALGAFGIIAAGALVWSWLLWGWRWQMGEMIYWAGPYIDAEVDRRVDEALEDMNAATILRLADNHVARHKVIWARALCNELQLPEAEADAIVEAVHEGRVFPDSVRMAEAA